MTDRDKILLQDSARKAARAKVMEAVQQTREDLRPANILDRWKSRQAQKLIKRAAGAALLARKNRLLLGGLALGVLLFAARRPIASAAKKWREKYSDR